MTKRGSHTLVVGTIKGVLDRNRGVGPGFDALRFGLAAIIFIGHLKALTGHVALTPTAAQSALSSPWIVNGGWDGWYRPFQVSYVPAFFALSGFLVMGSATRTRATQTFLAYRGLRIFPALFVELMLSAFLLGTIFTTLPLREYFTDPRFFRYFGNLFGWVIFELPGVFLNNRVPKIINANLWTLPSEFDCYLVTAFLMSTGFLVRSKITIILIISSAIFIILNSFTDFDAAPHMLESRTITYYFFVGVLFFIWREYIPLRWWMFLLAAALAYAFQLSRHTIYIAPVFVTYCTIFIGMLALPKIPIISTGDYSYGIYLYGYPITQAVLAALPALRGQQLLAFCVSGTITFSFAILSWHGIEKRMLAMKSKLPREWFPVAIKGSSLPAAGTQSATERRVDLVSVIIPHFNDYDRLEDCLTLLGQQTFPHERTEIIVADNGSECGIEAVRRLVADRALVIEATERGAAAARNAAVSVSQGRALAFIDSDCRPDSSWLEEGLMALNRTDFVGGRIDVQVAEGGMTPAEAFESVFAFKNDRYVREEGFTVTASMFVWRSVFDAVGGFQNGVPEDKDWCHRARKLGYRIGYAPKSVVTHPARRTMPELKRKWRRMTLEGLEAEHQKGTGSLSIMARQWIVLLSIFPHSVAVLRSRRLTGLGDKLRAIQALVQIRAYRFLLVHHLLLQAARPAAGSVEQPFGAPSLPRSSSQMSRRFPSKPHRPS
jgi:peptidoglycan/LPS O-acetylase OafA/YrhL/GT2 family glycosyltransferase